MQKPVCVKCSCYFRPHKNGIYYLEMKPIGAHQAPRGNEKPEEWEPYKLWYADLWKCPNCRHEMITGSGINPVIEDFRIEFDKEVESLGNKIIVRVNDC